MDRDTRPASLYIFNSDEERLERKKNMKNSGKWKAIMMVMVLLMNVLILPGGAGSVTEAASKKVTVKKIVSVNSLTGSRTIRLAKGKKASLKTTVTVTPNKTANKKVTYKSSNKKIATVSKKGVITGKKAGTAKITVASAKNSKKKAVVTVKVVKGKVTGIRLNKTSGSLTVGDTEALKATVKISKGGSKDVVWTTSNRKVATVSKKGVVRAVGAGTAAITVKAADGTGKKAAYKVTVKKKGTADTQANTLKNTAGKNASDVAVLEKIIKEQAALEADVSWNLNDSSYTWDKNGRLTAIDWEFVSLCGDISMEGLSALTSLNCAQNSMSSLDVSKNTSLTYLDCNGAGVKTLDVSRNTALTYLNCSANRLKSLDVSKNAALTHLDCNCQLDEVKLSSLDVSKNTALTYLDCGLNQLGSLDVSKNTALTQLDCYANRLTNLDVSKNAALKSLECSRNKLTSLDVSGNLALTQLKCYSNELISLDVSRNTALTYLDCQYNQLSELKVGQNLKELYHDNGVTPIRN